MVRAIVFDLDGTLVDSAPDLQAAANRALAALGRPALSLERIVSFVGEGAPKLIERCLEATGGGSSTLAADALARFLEAYGEDPTRRTRPYPGVEPLLAALDAAGAPLAVCTNKPEAAAEAVLDRLGLRSRFRLVVGGDRLAARKPDPAPLRLCFETLGAAAEAGLYVGDSEIDERTAQALGAPFALFTGGYRKKPPEAFEAAFRFDAFADLAAHLDLR